MILTRTYLHLPVKTGAPMRRMRVEIADAVAREFDIELAVEDPDFWVFLDISGFRDKEAALRVDGQVPGEAILAAITQGDTLKDAEDLYREELRPQFHFSSRRGWINDPNGLVHYDGEYHLYYQHNPYGWNWGNMHWGHAVSTDLVHWQEEPIAIYPRQFGDWAFSGSAAVDWENTGGFKQGDEPVIVAAYTSTGRGECIAYSLDRGRSFIEYEGNPVITHEGRDPKLLWYAPGRHWVMALYSDIDQKQTMAFYTSPDLRQWQYQSHIEGFFECPELFALPLDGNEAAVQWVIYGGNGDYQVGDFDGTVFTPQSDKLHFNHGNRFYASQTFNDIPGEDGRRIQIAWGGAWGEEGHTAMPFNHMMNFPVVLTLRTTDTGPRLYAEPVEEIQGLYKASRTMDSMTLTATPRTLAQGELLDLAAVIEPGNTSEIGISVHGLNILYDVKQQELRCGETAAPLPMEGGRITLRLLTDRTSVELFANDGRVYMPMHKAQRNATTPITAWAHGGTARLNTVTVRELASAWKPDRQDA